MSRAKPKRPSSPGKPRGKKAPPRSVVREKPRLGLAGKLSLFVGVVLFGLLAVTSVLSLRVAERAAVVTLERQGDAIASTLNHSFEVLVNQGELTQLQRVAANTAFLPDVEHVTVVDAKGVILASTDRTALGKPTNSTRIREALGHDEYVAEVYHDEGKLVFVRPLFSGKYTTGTDSGIVGVIEVGLDRRAMQARANEKARLLLSIQLGAYLLLSILVALALRALVVKPLVELAAVARRAQAGDRGARMGRRSGDELGVVSEAFDAMAAEVEQTVATLEETVAARTRALAEEVRARTQALESLEAAHAEKSRANDELRAAKVALERALGDKSHANDELRAAKLHLEAALDDSLRANEAVALAHADLERTHGALVTSMAERLALAETIQELSTPVMRIYPGILTMPLVGRIDAARAKQIEAKLLAGIERHDAAEVLVDLSGVPYVDVEVARALVRAKRCGELVGARVSLVGLRADVARCVAQSGLDLTGLTTRADLEQGLLAALRRRGLTIRARENPR